MNRLKHTRDMEINFCEKWPFRIEITSKGKEIFSFDRIAHSTKQKTVKDCEQAAGFTVNERDNVIALLENQKADIRLFSCAPEMLECLIDIYFQCGTVMDISTADNIFEQINNKFKIVIEKATGLKIDEVIE